MDEFFAIVVDGHIETLEKILKIAKAVDTSRLDYVDTSRVGDVRRDLTREIESFRTFAESARKEVAA